MLHCPSIVLFGVIALLAAIVALLAVSNLRVHRKLNDKNEVIIQGIRENIALRDELQRRLEKENTKTHSHGSKRNV